MADDDGTTDDAGSSDGSGGTGTTTKADDTKSDLGDEGKRALAAERDARRKAEREAKTHKAELDRIRAEGQSDTEKAIEKARQEARDEALASVRLERVRDKIEVKAAGKLVDASDGPRYLDAADFVDKDGVIDEKAIARALDQLVKDRPHLAGGAARSTNGSADGGARGGTAKAVDMNAWLRGERASL